MKGRILAAVAVVAMAGGCGSATDSVTFSAPPGFASRMSMGPFMQMWTSGSGGSTSILMLVALPTQTDLDTMYQSQAKNAQNVRKEHVSICGGKQSAVLATFDGTRSRRDEGADTHEPMRYESIATDVNGKTYMAMYGRPLAQAADPVAEDALKNICAK